jgi:hypothetical protein
VENDRGLIAGLGRLTLNGSGGIIDGNERRTEDGGFESVFSVTGNYSVNSDGTGTLKINFVSGLVDTWTIATASNGQSVKLVSIQPNTFAFDVVTASALAAQLPTERTGLASACRR